MTESTTSEPDDLTGTPDDRMRQLDELAAAAALSAAWLRRQLDAALAAWADEETALDVEVESRVDF